MNISENTNNTKSSKATDIKLSDGGNNSQKKLKLLFVLGTRPDAIKQAPVVLAAQKDPRFEVRVCSTGQHQEMLQQVLDWFKISPDYQLNVMTHAQPLNHMAGRILNGINSILDDFQPDVTVVQGDTTTTLVGALASYYAYNIHTRKPIQVAHIEAGLRTHNMFSPFPEEGNRRLVSPLATWHFAPTLTAAEALYEEGVRSGVSITGNTVIDALFETVAMLKESPLNPLPQIPQDEKIILVTGHRRESYGEGFHNICTALRDIALKYPDAHIVYPVHLNPYVKEPVNKLLAGIKNVHLIRPMDYPNFIAAMMRAYIILTDSGGVQEEAPSLGKPVLVLRDTTERPEAVEAGTVKVVGTDVKTIVDEASLLMDSQEDYDKMATSTNPYGDGHATARILNLIAGEKAQGNTFAVVA